MPGNYRSDSLTPIVCKLSLGMIKDHIQKVTNENSIISSKQHRFMKNRSYLLTTCQATTVYILRHGRTCRQDVRVHHVSATGLGSQCQQSIYELIS